MAQFGELSTAQEELLGIFKGFNMSTITFTILCVTLLGVVLKPYMILFGGTYTGWFIPAILQFIAIWHTGREDRDEMEYSIEAGDASHRKKKRSTACRIVVAIAEVSCGTIIEWALLNSGSNL